MEKTTIKGITTIAANELQEKDIPQPIEIVENLLTEGLTILAGAPKIGKSWISLQLGISVASGEQFLDFKTVKNDVLYLALEDSYSRLQKRLNIMLEGESAPERFFIRNTK